MEAQALLKPGLIIFDKDGTLCKSVMGKNGKSHAPNRLEEQTYFEDVKPMCDALRAQGHTLAVASNQGGVAFGIFAKEEADLLVQAAAHYIGTLHYRVCFHHPKGHVRPYDSDSRDRKPGPGMLESLMRDLGFTPAQTLMVGDWEADHAAAEAAGCGFMWAHEFFQREDEMAQRLASMLDYKP